MGSKHIARGISRPEADKFAAPAVVQFPAPALVHLTRRREGGGAAGQGAMARSEMYSSMPADSVSTLEISLGRQLVIGQIRQMALLADFVLFGVKILSSPG